MIPVRVGFALGRLVPLRAHVVLATQRRTELSGNLLYIQQELRRRTPAIPSKVLAYRTASGIVGRAAAAWQAARAGYHLATARVFVVDDWFFPMDVISPRTGTYRVQTWHGAGAFKKVGYSVIDKSFGADEKLIRTVRIHCNYDLCLTSSERTTDHYMEAFRLPRQRFTSALGLPRTDLFFDDRLRSRATEALRRRYLLPPNRRILLYAPTYRGDSVTAARHDEQLDLHALHDALSGEWVILLRPHPFVRRGPSLPSELVGFVIDASDWPDINELMLVSDLLVTDFSSAIFEYALLNRPMAFFAPDWDAYERDRGFYIDFWSEVPGPVFEETTALAAYLQSGLFPVQRVVDFAREWFDVADGHASERFVDKVVLPALRGQSPHVSAVASAAPTSDETAPARSACSSA